ncbi:ABC transporter substrate-binding protein [Alicyclobacillus fastidiosus]|uniref:ABC transporter substrate-binding protein n=1 Tax=Alicyclobacillus fastidiosus TaxID=392011 RepID=A0ABV5ALE6_9BACL|nr:ABC transporter substrate-binding protein [Alicyclobacillus fastidiosus]WEH11062.1 ABC transporter substrate-binding protein [Alicyclobacillus fastidiosus]
MKMGHKGAVAGVVSVCLSLALAGCGTTGSTKNTENASQTIPTTGSASTTVSVTDGTGSKVVLKHPATSFVCLDPSSIQMLKDLGVSQENIAYGNGDLSFAQMVYGNGAKNMKSVGGSWEQPNVEDILADHPDLVIGDAYPHAQLKPALKGATQMYLISRSGGYKQSMQDLINLGILTGHKAIAEQDANGFMKALNADIKKSPKNQTSLVIWGDSPTSLSVPTIDDPSASVLAAISKYPWGGHGAQGMNISLDKILSVNPDVIFVESIAQLDNPKAPTLSSQLASNPIWQQLKAVKDHRVYEVNPNVWHDDRGGMGLEQILDQAMPKLYPNLASTAQTSK